MTVRSWVLFDSDLPYDGVEEGPDFIQWPGKNVAEALADILIGCGYEDVAIDNLHHAGYEITFSVGKRYFGARVTVVDTYTVSIRPYSWLDEIFDRQRPDYLEALERLNAELARDGRFHGMRWFTRDELFTGVEGALSPLGEPLHHPQPFDKTRRASPVPVRPWVEFTADLPDEGIPTDDGNDFIQLPGRLVAKAISEMLARCGCKKIRRIHSRDLGWDITFLAGKRRLAARINLVGKFQVRFWQESWVARTFGLERPEYVEVLRRLDAEMAKDSRFHEVRWLSAREIQSAAEGALSPVADAS